MSERVAALGQAVMDLSERLRKVERLLASHRHSVEEESGVITYRPLWEGRDESAALEMMNNRDPEKVVMVNRYAALVSRVERIGGLEAYKEHLARVFEAVYRAAEREQDPENREKLEELVYDLHSSFESVDWGLAMMYDEWECVFLEFDLDDFEIDEEAFSAWVKESGIKPLGYSDIDKPEDEDDPAGP